MIWHKAVAMALVAFSWATPVPVLSATELNWDLSYRGALTDYPIGEREFMHVWVARYPQRIIHQQLAQYNGQPIKASLLFEKPDSHTGDPMAMWFVKTDESAYFCRMHRKIEGTKICKDLDAGRVQAFIEAAIALKPLGKQNNPKAVVGYGEDQLTINYYGFLSIYLPDRTLQRPLASIEMRPAGLNGKGAGRFFELMYDYLTSPEEKAAHQKKIDKSYDKNRLTTAAALGEADTLKELLDKGVTDQPEPGHPRRGSTLATAARYGHKHIIDILLERGHGVNDYAGIALRTAITYRRVDMVRYLLERGAIANSKYGPLELAVKQGFLRSAQVLLQHGANPNNAGTKVPLAVAAVYADREMVELLLKHGANPNKHGWKYPPLLRAVEYGVQATDGANSFVGRRSRQGVGAGDERPPALLSEIVRTLVQAGAKINYVSRDCRTAYSVAKEKEQGEMVIDTLIELGADPTLHQQCKPLK